MGVSVITFCLEVFLRFLRKPDLVWGGFSVHVGRVYLFVSRHGKNRSSFEVFLDKMSFLCGLFGRSVLATGFVVSILVFEVSLKATNCACLDF